MFTGGNAKRVGDNLFDVLMKEVRSVLDPSRSRDRSPG
jgi:hypothetical protein